jgi:hypothetical protein
MPRFSADLLAFYSPAVTSASHKSKHAWHVLYAPPWAVIPFTFNGSVASKPQRVTHLPLS